ncbi:2-keto-4-pentenoate hydratase [Sphingorhabdus sp.]|uniref:2-keto-4-pentenoate hydratase n=1 Tax=Sphingorhabdus sp. TaxID=1902408 RepID=UPI00391D0BD4
MTAAEIANHFVAARQRGQHLADYPGTVPDTLAAAYAVQDAAIAAFALPVLGWKVGRIFPPLSDSFGANRLSGPIFKATTLSDGQLAAGQVFVGGFGAAEAEFVINIASDLPLGRQDYTLEEVEDLIAAVHVGIEIASSPLPTINELGPAVTVSDFGNNNGLIIGAPIENWQSSNFADWTVDLEIDGTVVGKGAANSFPDGPIGSVRFLLNNLGARGIPVPARTWISSGAVTGVHKVTPGQSVRAFFGPKLSVNCTIEATPII